MNLKLRYTENGERKTFSYVTEIKIVGLNALLVRHAGGSDILHPELVSDIKLGDTPEAEVRLRKAWEMAYNVPENPNADENDRAVLVALREWIKS